MRIKEIKIENFRIYNGSQTIRFGEASNRNLHIISGKNGYGKTSFLTALIWVLYGKQMSLVENKYRSDIKNAGGYRKYLKNLINNQSIALIGDANSNEVTMSIELTFSNVLVPSINCDELTIKRSYHYPSDKEELKIFIDGKENELTREVGFEIFINDFILPREIAKFFFFDAEKIVELAEANSIEDLRTLSKAYSEVLGIKKYEDLREGLTAILQKTKRSQLSDNQALKLEQYLSQLELVQKEIKENISNQKSLETSLQELEQEADSFQEKLIREGNEISLEELKSLKEEHLQAQQTHVKAKEKIREVLEIIPFMVAKKSFSDLVLQIKKEEKLSQGTYDSQEIQKLLDRYNNQLLKEIKTTLDLGEQTQQLKNLLKLVSSEILPDDSSAHHDSILLDLESEQARKILALESYISETVSKQLNEIIRREKLARSDYHRLSQKVKQAEARKNNPLAQEYRAALIDIRDRSQKLIEQLRELHEESGSLQSRRASITKVISELEKNYELSKNDNKKAIVLKDLLARIETLLNKIKSQKRFSLERSILLGLQNLMHKNNWIHRVVVNIDGDVMDIDLIDEHGEVIDKTAMSKGEQQLYASALLNALVKESNISFPVFIDSPLQKFDRSHAVNIITNFYPNISDQVILFPLLEKELTRTEYELLSPKLVGTKIIESNGLASRIEDVEKDQLFERFAETI